MRRVHRGGEGQYLINGTAVRRTDLVELLADVGLGGAAGSVISQGKVEQILASKPEERRALVEEAAGLGKFKRRRHRAELKLARVGQDVARARDIEAEVKKRLRPLALQASAAQRAEKLGGEIASLEAAVATLDLAAVDERIGEASERRAAADHAKRRTEGKLEELLAERHRAEEELADAAGKRESATAALYRLKSAGERLELRRESAAALVESLRHAASRPRLRTGPSAADLRRLKAARGGRSRPGTARGARADACRARGRSAGGACARRSRPRAPAVQARGRSGRRARRDRSPARPRRRRRRARRADGTQAGRRGSGGRAREPERGRRRDRRRVRRRRARRAPAAVDRGRHARRHRLRPVNAGGLVPRRGCRGGLAGARGPPPGGCRRGRGAGAAGGGRRRRARSERTRWTTAGTARRSPRQSAWSACSQ